MLYKPGFPRHRENRENGNNKIPVRENTGNLEILPKHKENTGIWFAQVVNSLVLKVRDIAIFAAKISILFQKLDRSANSVLCM